ncbi:MAG: hypothetical protein MN733_10630 [Nitrososphaera sp.]|nr:hypothetical protein [Nitrososphaera sp.]
MPDNKKEPQNGEYRVPLTARLSLAAYDAISELRRQHRRKTGRALPIWKVIDAAIKAYARERGVKVEE